MLPVVAGVAETRRQILIYSLVLAPVGASPWLFGYAGLVYGAVAIVGGALMIALARGGSIARRPHEPVGQAAVRRLDPLSVRAVRRAAGRAALGLQQFGIPFGRVFA